MLLFISAIGVVGCDIAVPGRPARNFAVRAAEQGAALAGGHR
nr:hypothetical protein [Actinoplanes polyasparticus]